MPSFLYLLSDRLPYSRPIPAQRPDIPTHLNAVPELPLCVSACLECYGSVYGPEYYQYYSEFCPACLAATPGCPACRPAMMCQPALPGQQQFPRPASLPGITALPHPPPHLRHPVYMHPDPASLRQTGLTHNTGFILFKHFFKHDFNMFDLDEKLSQNIFFNDFFLFCLFCFILVLDLDPPPHTETYTSWETLQSPTNISYRRNKQSNNGE